MNNLIAQSGPEGPAADKSTLAAILDKKIAAAKQKVTDLEAAKTRLSECGLMNMRLDDLRAATRLDDEQY